MTEAPGPRGYDAGKKVKGRKRHAMTDTDGRLLALEVQTADTQDRDGAVPLLKASRRRHPFVGLAYADGAYNSERVASATAIVVQIVRKLAGQVGFVVHPRRWVIERRSPTSAATAFLYAASAMLLIRRIARSM